MKKRLGPALALMVLCAFSASALDTAQFSKTCTITLAGYTGSTTLAGFPVLVRLSSAIEGFDYADVMQGGADICFGGIGINGHLAFNEPQPGLPVEAFLSLPTRVLAISRETLTVNAIGVFTGAILGVSQITAKPAE